MMLTLHSHAQAHTPFKLRSLKWIKHTKTKLTSVLWTQLKSIGHLTLLLH